MYTDGETFYYRSDQPNRVPDRTRSGAEVAGLQPSRSERPALADRLRRLESQTEELQTRLTALSETVSRLTARPESAHAPKQRASVPAPPEVRKVAPLREPGSGGEEAIRASVFAGESVTAVLGPIRFSLDEE